jgi:phage gpG-like protein
VEVAIEVQGLLETQEKLERIAAKAADNNIVSKVAYAIELQAKENASGRPGPNVQTGRLRASVQVKLGPKPVTEATVGTNVIYAAPVEFGHKQTVGRFVPAYNFDGGFGFRLKNPTAPAYPFLGPAMNTVINSGEANGIYADFVTDIERT